jgi:hypothetical protein
MTYKTLAKRSGISMPTVVRILSSKDPHASFGKVSAIAQALALAVVFQPTATAQEVKEAQAEKKARRLVGLVQGTSGLESQAVAPPELEMMVRQTAHELLAGPPRNLWSS